MFPSLAQETMPVNHNHVQEVETPSSWDMGLASQLFSKSKDAPFNNI